MHNLRIFAAAWASMFAQKWSGKLRVRRMWAGYKESIGPSKRSVLGTMSAAVDDMLQVEWWGVAVGLIFGAPRSPRMLGRRRAQWVRTML